MSMRTKQYFFILVDIALGVVAMFLAASLRFEFMVPMYYQDVLLYTVPLAVILSVAISVLLDCYNSVLAYFGFAEIIKQGLVMLFTIVLLLLIKLAGVVGISGSITVLYGMMFFLLSCAVRAIPRYQRWFLSLRAGRSGNNKKVLIIGAGEAGALMAKQILNNKVHGMYPVGFVDDDPQKQGLKLVGVKVLGNIDTVGYYAKKLGAEELLIAIPSASEEQMSTIYDQVSAAQLKTRVVQRVVGLDQFSNNVTDVALREVSIEDLLFRKPIKVDNKINRAFVQDRVVLVTGGAGSIGSELCRQILQNGCKQLIIYDINENGLFELNEELKGEFADRYVTAFGSVRDQLRLKNIFAQYKPQIVFHAAAHKHVPMMEINPFEAIKNNIFGTKNLLEETVATGVEKFILISTDKAVNPTNVMGATKRICELLVKAYCDRGTECVAVRFGNVLGSNGSVIPLFKKQIAAGGPVTVTHQEMTRYFMTIPEAVTLVLSAGAAAKGSELFVLDMGKPVRIYDLAINLIRLSGLTPYQDIDIKITGLRDGEKMFEELKLDNETVDKTSHKKIFIMRDTGIDPSILQGGLAQLEQLLETQTDEATLRECLFYMVAESSKPRQVTIQKH